VQEARPDEKASPQPCRHFYCSMTTLSPARDLHLGRRWPRVAACLRVVAARECV